MPTAPPLRIYLVSALLAALAAPAVHAQNGTWSTDFAPPLADQTFALSSHGDALYVGSLRGVRGVMGPASVWDGEQWQDVGPDFTGPVLDIEVFDGDVYVAGRGVDGGAIEGLARWDGQQWRRLGDGIQGTITSLASDGEHLYLGGGFRIGDGEFYYVARWNGSTLEGLGSGGISLSTRAETVEVYGGEVYAGGFQDGLSRWDGTSWASAGSIAGRTVSALAHHDGQLVVLHTGGIALWDGSTTTEVYAGRTQAVASHEGTLYASAYVFVVDGVTRGSVLIQQDGDGWTLAGDGPANAMVSHGGDLFVAYPSSVARWDGVAWHRVGPGFQTGEILRVVEFQGEIYGGGARPIGGTAATSSGANRIARWDGERWLSLGNVIESGTVFAFAATGTDLYVGGTFANAAGLSLADGVVRYDGSEWHNLGPGLQGGVADLHLDGAGLYAAGNFRLGEEPAAVARWDGDVWTVLPGLNAGAVALAEYGGRLCAGGGFRDASDDPTADFVACWDGSAWVGLGQGGPGTPVYDLSVWDGRLFAAAGGGAHLYQYDGAGWSVVPGDLSNDVYTLQAVAGGLVVGGRFTDAGGDPDADGLAFWNGSTWSALGGPAEFERGEGDGQVVDLALLGDDLWVTGDFHWVGGVQSSRVGVYTDASFAVSAEPDDLLASDPHVTPAPNPTSGPTQFLVRQPEGGAVRLAVYDVLGREVAVLLDGERPAGEHAVRWEADVPAGVYLWRLTADGAVRTGSVTVVR